MTIDNCLIDMRSLFTLISFATFIGILLWAWSARRKADFDAAAQLPFADEESREKQHG